MLRGLLRYRRILLVLLVLVMVFALASVAWAGGHEPDTFYDWIIRCFVQIIGGHWDWLG